VPPAGRKIVIPNVIGRQTTSANRALNLVPHATAATRPDFSTTAAGEVDFEYLMNDWYHLFSNAYKVRMVHCASFDYHTYSNEASPMQLEDYALGQYVGSGFLSLSANPNG
jgi:hypothetical protein